MKTDIRKLLPPSAESLARFEKCINKSQPSAKGFPDFYKAVNAHIALKHYQENQEAPESFSSLVSILCKAHGITQKKLFSMLKIKAGIGKQILNHAVEPYRISSKALAIFARRFGLSFDTLKTALLGSYSLFLSQKNGFSEQFARSSFKSQNQAGYTRQLTEAFKELRAKSKAYRESMAGTEEITSYLKELEQWMC